MSHITKIKIQVKSLEALKSAAARCGLVFREHQKTHKWYGQFVGDYASDVAIEQMGRCDHALGIPCNYQAYEVGVCMQADGSYTLQWDFWQGGYGLQDCIGKDGAKLIAEYGLEAALEAAQAQGWYCERSADAVVIHHPDGGVIIVNAAGEVDASQFTGASCVAACAPIEGALGSQSERSLKNEFYQKKQLLTLNGGE